MLYVAIPPLVLVKGFASGMDGVEMTARDEFIIFCWPGLVHYVYANGKIELLIDHVKRILPAM